MMTFLEFIQLLENEPWLDPNWDGKIEPMAEFHPLNDVVNNFRVSTVELPTAAIGNNEKYETSVLSGMRAIIQHRYINSAAAAQGHNKIVQMLQAGIPPRQIRHQLR